MYTYVYRCLPGPTRVLDANDISIASAVFAELTSDMPTDRQTDYATWSITIGGIYTRSHAIHGHKISNISTVYLNN